MTIPRATNADRSGTVTVLLATYNGAEFLDEQLTSIAEQTYDNWGLWVSDDGSTDETLDIIARFRMAHPAKDIRVLQGPQLGSAQNFFSLLTHPELPDTAVAFCDQDDVWMPHKLAHASMAFTTGQATAYVCTDIATDRTLRPFARQKRMIKSVSFRNALVQNVMRGNAIVLNRHATQKMRLALEGNADVRAVQFHDWWTYLMLTGMGVKIIVDQRPGLLYRQHGQNALGANVGIKAALRRLTLLASGEHQDWITENITALDTRSTLISQDNLSTLASFKAIRRRGGLRSAIAFLKSGIRWQSQLGTAIMALQALFGRL